MREKSRSRGHVLTHCNKWSSVQSIQTKCEEHLFCSLKTESLPSPSKHNPLAAETPNVKSWIISPDGQSQTKSLQSSRPSLWLTGDKKVFLRRFKLRSSNMSTIIPNSPPSWTPCRDLPTLRFPPYPHDAQRSSRLSSGWKWTLHRATPLTQRKQACAPSHDTPSLSSQHGS